MRISLVLFAFSLLGAGTAIAEEEVRPCDAVEKSELCKEGEQKLRCDIIRLFCSLEERLGASLGIDLTAGVPPRTRQTTGSSNEDERVIRDWNRRAMDRLKKLDPDAVERSQLEKLGCYPQEGETAVLCFRSDGKQWPKTGYSGYLHPRDIVKAGVIVAQDDNQTYLLEVRQNGSGNVMFRSALTTSVAEAKESGTPKPEPEATLKAAAESKASELTSKVASLDAARTEFQKELGKNDDQQFTQKAQTEIDGLDKQLEAIAKEDSTKGTKSPQNAVEASRLNAKRARWLQLKGRFENAQTALADALTEKKSNPELRNIAEERISEFNELAERLAAISKRLVRLKAAAFGSVTVSDSADVHYVSISFTKTSSVVQDSGAPPETISTQTKLMIDAGRYFFDVGVLVAFLPSGQGITSVGEYTFPGTTSRVVKVDDGWQPKAGLGINVYPGGRRRNGISSLRDCKPWGCLGEMLGIQVGTDPNLSKLEREAFYLGLLVEPVSGFAFTGGYAWFRTMQLAGAWKDGMPLRENEHPETRSEFKGAIYFGFSIATELLGTARAIARGLGQEASSADTSDSE